MYSAPCTVSQRLMLPTAPCVVHVGSGRHAHGVPHRAAPVAHGPRAPPGPLRPCGPSGPRDPRHPRRVSHGPRRGADTRRRRRRARPGPGNSHPHSCSSSSSSSSSSSRAGFGVGGGGWGRVSRGEGAFAGRRGRRRRHVVCALRARPAVRWFCRAIEKEASFWSYIDIIAGDANNAVSFSY